MNWVDVALLFVAASFVPLGLVAANYTGFSHLERIIGVVVVLWLLAVGLVVILVRLGLQVGPVVHTVFVGVVLLSVGGVIFRSLGTGTGLAALLAILVLSAFVFLRLPQSALPRALVIGLAVALASGPLISVADILGSDRSGRVIDNEPLTVSMTSTPDIFLIILDGYPGSIAFQQDFDTDMVEFVSKLELQGFEVPNSAWTSYWTTQLAVASILDAGYPLMDEWEGKITEQRLYDRIGGDNALVETLRDNGYETHMVESGWSGSGCDAAFYDRCVPAPFLDEAMFLFLRKTLAEPFVATSGGPFAEGAVHAMEWLLENGESLSRSVTPDFVFAHFVAPHAPFFLDSGCDRAVTRDRSGITFNLDGVPETTRERFFLEQAACLNSFMVQFADLIDEEDVVVYVSDHGTDRRFQLSMDGEDWTKQSVVERMNVMMAVRAGSRCTVGDNLVTPNLMRRVLDCHTSLPIDDVEPRMWIRGMVELEAGLVEDLLAGGSLRND